MLRCGKHRGATFEQAAEDRGYCAWVLRETADGKWLPRDLRAFCDYLRDKHGGVLCIGKHKNRFFDEVLTDDPDYVAWAANLRDPSSAMKAFVAYANGLGSARPLRGQPLAPKPNPRANISQEVLPKCTPVRKTIQKRPPRQNKAPQALPHNVRTTPSVFDMLCRRKKSGPLVVPEAPQQVSEPTEPIEEVTRYVDKLKCAISEGRVDLRGDPWVVPGNPFQEAVAINARRQRDGERQIDATEALNLVMRPKVFAWAPEKIFPGRRLRCPICGSTASFGGWKGPRVLHSITGQCVYIATRHECRHCRAISGREAKHSAKKTAAKKTTAGKRPRKMFMADGKEALAQLPANKEDRVMQCYFQPGACWAKLLQKKK